MTVRRINFGYILLIVAAVCCTIAGFWEYGSPNPYGFRLGWIGIAFFMWSLVLSGAAASAPMFRH